MSQDESVTIVPEEEVYEKIEKALLAFGFRGHKGLLLRRSRKKGIKVYISLALHKGCRVNETARYIQMVVRNLLLSLTDETIYGIDVTITDIVD